MLATFMEARWLIIVGLVVFSLGLFQKTRQSKMNMNSLAPARPASAQ